MCFTVCVCLSSRLTHGFSMVSFIAEAELLLSSLLCNLHSFHFCFSCGTSSSVFTTWSLQGPGTIWLHFSGILVLRASLRCVPIIANLANCLLPDQQTWGRKIGIWVSNIICYWKLELERTILITHVQISNFGSKIFQFFFRNQTCLLQQCALSKSTFINVITLSNLK